MANKSASNLSRSCCVWAGTRSRQTFCCSNVRLTALLGIVKGLFKTFPWIIQWKMFVIEFWSLNFSQKHVEQQIMFCKTRLNWNRRNNQRQTRKICDKSFENCLNRSQNKWVEKKTRKKAIFKQKTLLSKWKMFVMTSQRKKVFVLRVFSPPKYFNSLLLPRS